VWGNLAYKMTLNLFINNSQLCEDVFTNKS